MTNLGDWVVGEAIGHGANTVVHRGHHRLHPDRVVAIKRIRNVAGGLTPDAIATVEREAGVLARLAHPAIMPFVDVVVDGDGVALVMPLATGGSLAARIRAEGAVAWTDVVDLGARVSGGLAAAHGAGIVHRDITTTNILYGRELEPRLADFGAALLEGPAERIVGTPGYLDPHVAQGGSPGPSSDIYGLGVVMWEALAGQPPFAGANPEAVMRAADRGVHLPLASLVPDVPANLAAIVEQAMHRTPSRRFSSAQQLQVELEHVQLTTGAGETTSSPPQAPVLPTSRDTRAGDSDDTTPVPAWIVGVPDDDPAPRLDRSSDGMADDGDSSGPADPRFAATAAMGGAPTAAGAGGGGGSSNPTQVPPTTDFGPRPIAPLVVEESPRPWWMYALLATVVVVPLVVATWVFASSSDGPGPTPTVGPTAVATPRATSASATDQPTDDQSPATNPSATDPSAEATASGGPVATATPGPSAGPTPSGSDAGFVVREPAPPCNPDVEEVAGQVLLVEVDDRGCSLAGRLSPEGDVVGLELPPDAGDIAGRYELAGPPRAVVVGDWDGDGVDTPAVVLDPDGAVWAFASWDARVSMPLGNPIGLSDPVVVTGDDGTDFVVAGDEA